ncbi:hypothetical protein LCGC14_0108200 [marine sediment metagenome]|uniref:TIR domain-containing protein n=1 Tax=marine sediment metagenome TaxID=412755 RepID=A0A0F9YD61_9ZZZZ|nr:toll/interleukin-1 receptor domain-containing protein [Halomonas sp.]HDZ47684.1 TIR domain-containing protein [Halomonas sp.]
MPDVYLIYAKENRDTAVKVRDLLSSSWNVWLDDRVVGDFGTIIKEKIQSSKCVVALYSSFASKPAVTGELSLAVKYDKKVIPLILDDSDPPYPYGHFSYIDFRAWKGDVAAEEVKILQIKVGEIIEPQSPPSRLEAIHEGQLPIPNVFMSVSSHETQFTPAEALSVLNAHKTGSILVSAYDLVKSEDEERKKIVKEIQDYRSQGGFVLIDSGNYEADRMEDKDWTPSHFKEALLGTPHDWAFCFDEMKPSKNIEKAIEEVVQAVKRDSEYTQAPVLPIVHVSQDEAGLKRLPQIVRGVSERLRPQIIAIAERELGAGMVLRARTMKKVRTELDKLSYYQPIHLLGTGNPWSIAVLVAAGADTFDGLEWCRFSIDREENRLHHFQHFDFFRKSGDRTPFLNMVDAAPDIKYAGRVALYNLEYYKEFGVMMRSMIATKEAELFAIGITRMSTARELRKLFPEIFS